METFVLAVVLIALLMAAMAVGVLLTGRPLRGSCGGPPLLGPDGEAMTCPDCDCQKDGGIEIDIDAPRGEHA